MKEKGWRPFWAALLAALLVRASSTGREEVVFSTEDREGAGKAAVQDRPGVTRQNRWFTVGKGFELLDTPGVLWPKFEDQSVGLNLAYTGAVKDDIMDVETLGCHLMTFLATYYPDALAAGYKLSAVPQREEEENDVAYGYRLLETCAQKRGMRITGGEFDTERMARVLLDEYRGGKLGRFTLEQAQEN